MKNRNLLQIDEQGRMTHPRRLMSFKKFILGFAAALGLTTANAAEIPNGQITREQCIQIALENNLNVRISHYGPEINNLRRQQYYGTYYDPRLSLGTDAFHREQKKNADPTQFSRGNTSDGFANRLGLSGKITPFGTGFNFSLRGDGAEGSIEDPFTNKPSIYGNSGGSASISISQPMLRDGWGIGHRVEITLRKNAVKNSSEAVIGQIILTVTRVERAYYALIASRENIKVAEETLELTAKNYSNQKRRAEVGTLAKSQLPQLEAELLSQKAQLLSVHNTHAKTINDLKRLLTDDFAAIQDKELTPIGELNPVQTVFDRADSWDKALKQRPDINQLKITLENNNINLKYSKNQLWPQLDLSAFYNLRGDDVSAVRLNKNGEQYFKQDASFNRTFREIRGRDNPNYGVGLTLTIPLGNRVARANYDILKLQNEQALLNYKGLEQSIMIEIDQLIREAEYRFKQIEVRRQSRISSELALDNDTKRYNEGAIENYQVLQAQRDLTDRRYAEINAKLQYLISLSDLAEAEGSTLDNNNINVEFEEE